MISWHFKEPKHWTPKSKHLGDGGKEKTPF